MITSASAVLVIIFGLTGGPHRGACCGADNGLAALVKFFTNSAKLYLAPTRHRSGTVVPPRGASNGAGGVFG
jgi:hypothetical protein